MCKAIIFIEGPNDGHVQLESHFKSIMPLLGVTYYHCEAVDVPEIAEALINDPEIGVVVTYGCLSSILAIATAYEKLAVVYDKSENQFVPVDVESHNFYDEAGNFLFTAYDVMPFTLTE